MQLTTFQDGFAAALLPLPGAPPAHPAWLDALLAQPGFAVYRNTVLKGCIDALQANFPTVCALVGEEWFRAAAGVFAHAQPPHDGLLMDYGVGFAAFLDDFGPAANLPYLGAVARLDRCWTEAHLAANAPPLDPAWLAQQTPDTLAGIGLRPHPSARWVWCEAHPAFALWQRQREDLALDAPLTWQGDGGLLTRPGDAVQWTALPRAGVALLDACATQQSLDSAVACALDAEPGADLSALMALLLKSGALTLATPHRSTP